MPLFRFKSHKKEQQYDFSKTVEHNVAHPKTFEENITINDLPRAGTLKIITASDNTLESPIKKEGASDEEYGEELLDWLKMNLLDNLPRDENSGKIINYIAQTANQNGFLFAGRDSIEQLATQQGFVPNLGEKNNEPILESIFHITPKGTVEYEEKVNSPRAYINPESGDMLTSETPLLKAQIKSSITVKDGAVIHKVAGIHTENQDKDSVKVFGKCNKSSIIKSIKSFLNNKYESICQTAGKLFSRSKPNKP